MAAHPGYAQWMANNLEGSRRKPLSIALMLVTREIKNNPSFSLKGISSGMFFDLTFLTTEGAPQLQVLDEIALMTIKKG